MLDDHIAGARYLFVGATRLATHLFAVLVEAMRHALVFESRRVVELARVYDSVNFARAEIVPSSAALLEGGLVTSKLSIASGERFFTVSKLLRPSLARRIAVVMRLRAGSSRSRTCSRGGDSNGSGGENGMR